MPLAVVPLLLPADLVEVRAGDVDLDGRDELILISQTPSPRGPDTVTLTVVHLSASGREEGRDRIELGNEALLWDIHSGLWGIDAAGVRRLTDGERLIHQPTLLAALGPTTPLAADVMHDLDDNGVPEVLVPAKGRLWAFSGDGQSYGSVPASISGELSTRSQSGGQALVAAATLPPFVVGDIDGDGIKDILQPAGAGAVAHITGETIGEQTRRLRLPIDLAPSPAGSGAGTTLSQAWFVDIDGDGRLDLLTHSRVTDGSWFGATATFALYLGTGTAFVHSQTLSTDRSAVNVRLLDFDNDGDTDLIVSQVDTGLGSMGRALLAREVVVEVGLYRQDHGRYPPQPALLRRVIWPMEQPEQLQFSIDGDLNGDGHRDLITNDSGSTMRVYLGSDSGFATAHVAEATVTVPEAGALLAQDLTGDGRAEVLVWGQGARQGSLLHLE